MKGSSVEPAEKFDRTLPTTVGAVSGVIAIAFSLIQAISVMTSGDINVALKNHSGLGFSDCSENFNIGWTFDSTDYIWQDEELPCGDRTGD
ncbi:hypothetical protein V1514DRAFT_318840 [Lipomyces japonicus]|uniref:uncharacterized protein n=1 Tax=Lipomyces japonicus TaxID=56871 RepID=UPI0034CD9AB3